MIEKNGKENYNARIRIKYNKNKPLINFSYPNKKLQVRGDMQLEWVMFTTIVVYIITLFIKFSIDNKTNYFISISITALTYLFFSRLTYPLVKNILEPYYPKWNGFISRKKLAIFKTKDIKQQDNKIFCELPLFSNVILRFKATKQFSDYLDEIEIQEHKFVYLKKKRIIINKKKKRFHKVNEWLWYARFYFKQIPTNGELRVIFK